MDTLDITTCSGTFYDPGGPDLQYGLQDSSEIAICPQSSEQAFIQLNFTDIDLAISDWLRFYDGLNSTAPQLSPPINIFSGQPFSIRATDDNPSGCLTVQFITNGDTSLGEGWEAEISCLPLCQRIFNQIDISPSQDSTEYMRICAGSTIALNATPSFPDNNLRYEQSVDSTSFNWVYQNDTIGREATSYWTVPDDGFGYLQLSAMDQKGCPSQEFNRALLFVVPSPEVVQTGLPDLSICPGDTIQLYTASGMLEEPGFQVQQGLISSTAPINDENFIFIEKTNPPATIVVPILTENYPANAQIGGNIQLDSLRFLLEHSYAGDLDMTLVCPNGQSATILSHPAPDGYRNRDFGDPWALRPTDFASSDHTPGLPYYYTISDQGTTTLLESDSVVNIYTTVPSEQNGLAFTQERVVIPQGVYQPETAFSELAGCPLNGVWELQINDNIHSDNGWLFGASLHFSQQIPVDDPLAASEWSWVDNNLIVEQNENIARVIAVESDLQEYIFRVENLYGCVLDTSYHFDVLPEDSNYCQGFVPTVPDIGLDPLPWPNPFHDELNFLLLEEETSQIYIYASSGQLMFKGKSRHTTLDTSSWATGLYLVQLVSEDGGNVYTKRIIKQ